MPSKTPLEATLIEYSYPILIKYLVNSKGLNVSRNPVSGEVESIIRGSIDAIVEGSIKFLQQEQNLSTRGKLTTVSHFYLDFVNKFRQPLANEILFALAKTNWGGLTDEYGAYKG